MRRKIEVSIEMIARIVVLVTLLSTNACDGARRTAQRRKDTSRSPDLYEPTPSAESLQAIAEAMGAAGFEHYTEGRPLVKRLIPVDNQSDLDLVEQQGVIGKAGVDFPAYPNIPNTGFSCKNVPTGYYADLETDCQVFHICDTSRKISFLCPNGTIFSQSHLICDWWFKVDCASSPALYESSAEYYSNEQKKSQKVSQSLSKNYQPDNNNRAESRRTSVNVPSTTERLLRHRQRLQTDTPLNINGRPTPRSFQTLIENYNPTQRSQLTTAFENRRRNLVQLISNNFGNSQVRTTSPSYAEISTFRTPGREFNGLKEMQVAAETASFANNNNRQFLQDYHNKNYRPYPVYTPNTVKPKAKNNPNLTTLYDIRDKLSNQAPQESTTTTKRPTLVPYTKSYVGNDNRDPYTRPGVSLLKDFLQKEKNKTLAAATTEKISQATDRSDNFDKQENTQRITIESKNSFESVTKIPHTTRAANAYFPETTSDKYDIQGSTNYATEASTEPTYQERRERLMRKLHLDQFNPTEPTLPATASEKFYGDLPNRPGLVVPPSLTPKTLHSLAIYYATALDNLSTTPNEDDETTTPAFYDYENIDGLPGLFSQQTINKYGNLFGQAMENAELLEEMKMNPNGTYNELSDDLSVQQSQNPIATSPQIRELAQVFTHALSAYLQDPVQFRKVLSDIRPTHPSFGDLLTTTEESYNSEPTTTVNEDDDEILGFSDDNKVRPGFSSIREPKALSLATDYPTVTEDLITTPRPATTEVVSTTYLTTSPRIPFRCCGRISASYTTSSTPLIASTTSTPITNTYASSVNTLVNNYSETTTENTYSVPRFGGFQNNIITGNDSPYGKESDSLNAKPLNEYVEATNLPTAWGIDSAASTNIPAITTDEFESKKIQTTTYIPTTTAVYFTETDSVELENEEELQRAHSQSFATPQGNNIRQGKQQNIEETKPDIKKPSEDLEAPTLSDFDTTIVHTTAQPTTSLKIEESEPTTASPLSGSIFTSPDSGSTFVWSSTFDNWHSTVIDPITLNDGLSPSGPEQVAQLARETNGYIPSTTNDYTATTEQAYSSTVNIELSSPGNSNQDRSGRLLKDTTSTESSQDLSAITDTVVEKAKEIMGGMNATTTEKLMNVMKKTKSKTVRRLILLLVQTCDDDHNTTAEASKKALLEALMAVSQQDMDEIAKEEGVTDIQLTANDYETTITDSSRKTDRPEARPRQERRGKSLNFDPNVINSLSTSVTTENVKTTTEDLEYASTTLSPKTTTNRRGLRKFHTKKPEIKATRASIEGPTAEARIAPQGSDVKGASDTRALELLRSLYSIAARWG